MAYIYFTNMAKHRHLGISVINQNYFHSEVSNRLNLGNMLDTIQIKYLL